MYFRKGIHEWPSDVQICGLYVCLSVFFLTGICKVDAFIVALGWFAQKDGLQQDDHSQWERSQIHAKNHHVQTVPPVQEITPQALYPDLLTLEPEETCRYVIYLYYSCSFVIMIYRYIEVLLRTYQPPRPCGRSCAGCSDAERRSFPDTSPWRWIPPTAWSETTYTRPNEGGI